MSVLRIKSNWGVGRVLARAYTEHWVSSSALRKPGVVMHACCPCTQEVEAGGQFLIYEILSQETKQ